jgi:hypothetical protein
VQALVTFVTLANVSDNVGALTGTVSSGGATDDETPTLTGTLTAALASGEKVSVYNGATKLGEAVVSGTNWTSGRRQCWLLVATTLW